MEQRSEEWFAARVGKVTASRIGDVMMARTTAGWQNYKAQLVCERLTGQVAESFTSAAMQHGTDTEPQARAFYEMESGNTVAECGFVDHTDLPMSGASPDGLIGDDGLVEIKCPQPAKHLALLTGANIDKGYLYQMQWQMECTGRAWCDFVSFSPAFPPDLQIEIRRVNRDETLLAEIRNAVREISVCVENDLAQLAERSK